MKPVQHERRAGRRYALQLPVILSRANNQPPVTGSTRDVSSCGVFFYTDCRLAPQSPFECSLILPDDFAPGKNVLTCSGHVVRVEEGEDVFGVGAKFDKVAFGDKSWDMTTERSSPDLLWLLRLRSPVREHLRG